MTTGLIVGKFAPFHAGHEHILRIAYASTDQLVVLLYDAPDCTNVPLAARAEWIRAAFPNAMVVEGYNPPPRGIWNEETMQAHEDFITNAVSAHSITHVYSSESYGERLALALGAEHMFVVKIRGELPLSASLLRKNPELYREFVQEGVYADLEKYGDVL